MPDITSQEGYQKYLLEVRSSYPDFHLTLDELIQEGDTVTGKGYWEGTQLGASPGLKVPPTGKKIRVKCAFVSHGADGKLVEAWMYQDWLGTMRQLGLLPQSDAA
jgi:predicted ester cyclase